MQKEKRINEIVDKFFEMAECEGFSPAESSDLIRMLREKHTEKIRESLKSLHEQMENLRDGLRIFNELDESVPSHPVQQLKTY